MLSVGNRPASQFAAARLVRLVPAYVFCVSLTTVMVIAAGDPHYSVTLAEWVANLTFLQEWIGFGDIDPSYWTLLLEVVFYGLVFAALAFGQRRRLERLVLAWLALQTLAVCAGSEWFIFAGEYAFFVLGCIVFFGSERGWNPLRVAAAGVARALGIFNEIGTPPALIRHGMAWEQATVAILLTAFAAAFVALGRRRPSLPWAGRLGALTYPLYLLHQVIGLIAIAALVPAIGKWPAVVSVSLVMIGLAWCVSEFVERRAKPLWRALAGRLVAPIAWAENAVAARQQAWSGAT
jgi:peptidoglycan/LPS O-acetylase OafA/YrhL